LKPKNRRLIIGWGTQLHQQLTGINVIMMYSVIIFGSANIPQFTGTIVVGMVNVASTFIAMKFIDKKGRKYLLLVGALVQAACFVLAAVTISASGLIKTTEPWPLTAPTQCTASTNLTCFGEVAYNATIVPTVTVQSADPAACCGRIAGGDGLTVVSYFPAVGAFAAECQLFDAATIAAAPGGILPPSAFPGAWSGGTENATPPPKGAAGFCMLFICLFVVGFGASWGPTAWVIGAEIYPLRVRAKALSVTTAAGNWLGTWLIGYATPSILSGLGVSGTFFLFAYFLLQAFVFVLFCVPETKGTSLEEIDAMFRRAKGWTDIAKPRESLAAIFVGGGNGDAAASKYVALEAR
jgi:hypothetical protein